MHARPLFRGLFVSLLVGVLVSCAPVTTPQTTTEAFTPVTEGRVLIMPLDIELYELTTAGLELPQAAWTTAGRDNVNTALEALMAENQLDPLHYGAAGDESIRPEHLQLTKLHEAVGLSILLSRLDPRFQLPSKEDNFDWTLGETALDLQSGTGADYALFVYFRDSFSTGGRQAMIFLGALLGAHVQGGIQRGFASLIDLRSGNVVWFHHIARNAGDLRDPEAAAGAARLLLEDFPLWKGE